MSGPSYHGPQTHKKGGTDEFGAIEFDVDNEGGYLDVTANDEGPGDLGIDIEDNSGGGARIASSTTLELAGDTVGVDGGTLAHFEGGGGPVLEGIAGEMGLTLPAGTKLVVRNHSNAAIFEVREDGSVHIPTGTSIVADL